MNIEISKLTITIGKREVQLTLEEAKELAAKLNAVFNTSTIIYTPQVYNPVPWPWNQLTCQASQSMGAVSRDSTTTALIN